VCGASAQDCPETSCRLRTHRTVDGWTRHAELTSNCGDVLTSPHASTREDAGLPKELVLYSARHSFATDLLDRTGNLKLVMDVLGHESVTTTQKYLHPALKNIAEVVNQRNEGREAEVAA
jgi:site-specific recombinase XerC